jgi:hypothetical protein
VARISDPENYLLAPAPILVLIPTLASEPGIHPEGDPAHDDQYENTEKCPQQIVTPPPKKQDSWNRGKPQLH